MSEQSRLFCDGTLAARIERAEARFIAKATEAAGRRAGTVSFAMPVAGGLATYAEHESPFNKVVGLGFGGIPSETVLDDIERAYAARGAPVQVELCHLADAAFGTFLTGRGYRLVSFENVLGRTAGTGPEQVLPQGVEVRRSGDDELESWLEVVVDAVMHPDTQGSPSHDDLPREAIMRAERDIEAAGVLRYVALRNGVVAGGGALHLAEGVAQFVGAATAPTHRRQGVQTALLSARLADAAAAGCDVAVVTTQPGSTSQQNVQRRGFDLLYTRAVLVKRP
ncbi:MAG: GNAT family N-acetyltransferase [Streptosporangiaceae bacterium]